MDTCMTHILGGGSLSPGPARRALLHPKVVGEEVGKQQRIVEAV